MSFQIIKCSSEEFGLTNKVYFNRNQFNDSLQFVSICTATQEFIFRGEAENNVPVNSIATNLFQRKWADLVLNQEVNVRSAKLNLGQHSISEISLEIDLFNKKVAVGEPLNSDEMSREFGMFFCNTPLSVNQQLLFVFKNKRFTVKVVNLHVMSLDSGTKTQANTGIVSTNSCITFEKSRDSQLILVGKSTKSSGSNFAQQSIISPNWDFNQLGIGGLDKEFSAIFRRTFASRMFPPEIAKQLGLKHVRGILLYGPPGTGKTLMARQIGKMLNAREPKIVNGPSILDKYVGESEANIRKLFADAEEEAKRMGAYSALHIIIFDEIDAICKQRGSAAGSSGVHDTVVNQLLTKMDGVEELNNILVIGMTNRKDMIDEALLRPGRFEMQMEISLPDEDGRLQIITIHTSKIKDSGKLDSDVDLKELAARTKNFSGAEIEGLVRSATNTAMYQLVKPNSKSQLEDNAFDKLSINRSHFIYALENDVKPMFGTEEEELSFYIPRGIINWDMGVTNALDMGKLAVKSVAEADVESYRPLTLLLQGPAKSGKTALAVEIAKKSNFPFIKICTTHKMTGFSEIAKCQAMKKIFDDAAKSQLSVVILDNIEALIEYNPVGPRFSNYLVQVIKDLISMPLKKGRRMLVIGTTSFFGALSEQNLCQAFTWTIGVRNIENAEQLVNVLEEDGRLNSREIGEIKKQVSKNRIRIGIKHLIELIDLVSKTDEMARVHYFISRLEEEDLLTCL